MYFAVFFWSVWVRVWGQDHLKRSVHKSSLLKGLLTECYASSRLSLDRWFMVLSGCIELYAGRSGCKGMGCGISYGPFERLHRASHGSARGSATVLQACSGERFEDFQIFGFGCSFGEFSNMPGPRNADHKFFTRPHHVPSGTLPRGFRVVSVWGVSVLLQGIGNGSTVEEPASVGSFEASGCEIFGVWG